MRDPTGLFGLEFDRSAAAPLYRQLYAGLRDAIVSGRLAPGDRLPSSRLLSADLGCSRNTVAEAYDLLAAEGYLEGRTGSGSYVSRRFADSWIARQPAAERPTGESPPPKLSRAATAMEEIAPPDSDDRAVLLSDPSGPDISAFPFEIWARTLARAWRRPDPALAAKGDPMGYPSLREAIAGYLGKVRALRCDAGQVMITSGAQHALDLVVRLLIDPGDGVWIEDPSYRGARAALAAAGARPLPAPVDDQGFDAARAEELHGSARAALVTPSRQFPLGATMTLQRRMTLLEWASREDAWIIEDDYDSEFLYGGRPVPALQGLDMEQRVIYVGSFSKAIFPALRLGYVVLPARLAPAFRTARTLLDGHTTIVTQRALAEFFADGQFTAHLRRVRSLYGERRDAMRKAVQDRLARYIEPELGEAGMHLLAYLRPGLNDAAISLRARKAGLICPALSTFYTGAENRSGLIIGFAGIDKEAAPHVVEKLASRMG